MKKTEIDPKDLLKWRNETWIMYASEFYQGAVLRMWTNQNGLYRVIHGAEILYEGSQLTHAIEAWRTA